MNIIVGMIRPLTNCAPNDASYSFSFSSAKVSSTSAWRPNTLTSAWPEKVSSMWELSRPVRRHWSMNMPWLRCMTCLRHEHRDRHRDQRDQRELPGDREHHDHHEDDGQQRRHQLAHGLLQGLADVVDVVGDPAQQLAARLLVEVAQGQGVDLVLDVGPHPVDRALDDVVEQVALEPRQQRRRGVHREGEHQHVADGGEVDALADHEVLHRGDHRGLLVVTPGPEAGHDPVLRGAGRDALARRARCR